MNKKILSVFVITCAPLMTLNSMQQEHVTKAELLQVSTVLCQTSNEQSEQIKYQAKLIQQLFKLVLQYTPPSSATSARKKDVNLDFNITYSSNILETEDIDFYNDSNQTPVVFLE